MKRFVFSYERVRRFREQQAEIEEARLAALYGERDRLESEQRALTAERAAAEWTVLGARQLSGAEFATLAQYRVASDIRRGRIAEKQDDVRRRVAVQLAVVTEARRRVKLLDHLKDKALAEWQRAADHEIETTAADLHLAKLSREGGG